MVPYARTIGLLLMCLTGCNGAGSGGDTSSGDTSSGGRYHPADFAQAAVHGREAKFAVQDCKACHGPQLQGGSASQSCDTCHTDGWATNCTFCHGEAGGDGAPPQGIDDSTDPAAQVFPQHQIHLNAGQVHGGFACATCHVVPTDTLSEGHLWDGSAGVAEVDFASGIGAGGSYTGSGCSSSYCHGDGKGANGSVSMSDSNLSCESCHSGPGLGIGWFSLSGKHAKHLWEGITCSQCHGDTVSTSNAITGLSLHVNGQVDLNFTDGTVTYSNGRCSGSCHGEGHNASSW